MPRSQSRLVPVTATIAVLALVAFSIPWRNELASWRVAAAEQKWSRGEHGEALRELREVALARPDQIDWLMKTGQWALEQNQPEQAVEAIDLALKQLAGESRDDSDIAWQLTQFKAFALIRLGREDEAIEACQPFADQADPDPSRLNGLAYVYSLADRALDQSLVWVDEALSAFSIGPSERAHRLALLAWDAGATALAAEWIDRAIGEFEPFHRRSLIDFEDKVAVIGAGSNQGSDGVREEISRLRSERESLNKRRAMMHALRAAIRDRLDEPSRAEADREVVRELGFDPAHVVELRFVGDGLRSMISFLDTRAWVLFGKEEYKTALHDMNLAVELGEAYLAVDEAAFKNLSRQIVRSEVLGREIHEQRRMMAVFYYHRAQIHRALEQELEAFADEAKIRHLGFEPGPHLF